MVNMASSSPTPQSVGREFVRQYYTMLNQAPLHQHRFYSTNSSFVHGGSERKAGPTDGPVYGQQDIHARITQLNFDDCKAKIRQVDAHSTLGNGVVVQVCGELSNRGMPLRRFMQTFVLAPQSPKKYYVINDIFRYQDDVFSGDENDDADADDEADVRSNNASLDNSGGSQQDSFNKAAMTADVLRRTAGPLSDAVAAENFKNVEMSANAAAAAAAAAVTAVTAATHQPLQQAVKQLPGSQTGVGVGGDGITTVSITQQLAVDSPPVPDTTHATRPAPQHATNQQTTLTPKDVQVNGQLSKVDQVASPPRDQQPPAGQLLHQQLPDVAASAAARATVTAASPPQQQQQQQQAPKPAPPKPEPKPVEPIVVAAAPKAESSEPKAAEKAVAESVSQVPPSYATLVKSSGPPSGTGAIRAISPGSLPSAGFNKNPLGPSLSTGATSSVGAAGSTPSERPRPSSAGGGGTPAPAPAGAAKDSFASAASVQGGPKTTRPYGGRGSAGSAGRPSSTAGGSVRGYSESRSRDEREDHSRLGADRPRDNRNMPGSGFPDSQQIFVGNLPHTVTEQDLNTLFGEYGEVVEIRISIKGVQQSKLQPAGQKVPGFGFVVFADDEAARKCLDDTPIKLPDGHRLNVETKKNKQNMREARLQNSESYHSDHRGGPSVGGGGPNAPLAGGVKARLSSTSSNSGANNSFGGSQEQLGNSRWSGGGRGGGPRGGLGGSRGGRGGFGGSGRGSAPPSQGSSSGPSRGAYSGSRGRP